MNVHQHTLIVNLNVDFVFSLYFHFLFTHRLASCLLGWNRIVENRILPSNSERKIAPEAEVPIKHSIREQKSDRATKNVDEIEKVGESRRWTTKNNNEIHIDLTVNDSAKMFYQVNDGNE